MNSLSMLQQWPGEDPESRLFRLHNFHMASYLLSVDLWASVSPWVLSGGSRLAAARPTGDQQQGVNSRNFLDFIFYFSLEIVCSTVF